MGSEMCIRDRVYIWSEHTLRPPASIGTETTTPFLQLACLRECPKVPILTFAAFLEFLGCIFPQDHPYSPGLCAGRPAVTEFYPRTHFPSTLTTEIG